MALNAGPYGMGCKNKLTYRNYGGLNLALRRAIKVGSDNILAVQVSSYAEDMGAGKQKPGKPGKYTQSSERQDRTALQLYSDFVSYPSFDLTRHPTLP